MSIITRTIKFMGAKSCIPVKITNISLDEKKVTIYGEKYFYNEMQLWYGMTLIQNKGMLQDYSAVEQETYHKKRNGICNMTTKLIELIRTACGAFSSLTPMSEQQLQELSAFYQHRQNLDYPQEYFIYDWNEEGCFGTDLYVRAECLEPLEHIQKCESFTEEEVIQIGMQITKALWIYNKIGVSFLAMTPARIGRSNNGIYKVTPENWRWTYDKYALDNRCYVSTEELKQDKRDNKSDIYRLGLILYELCNHNKRLNCLHWYPSEQEALDRIATETTLSKEVGISDSLFQVLQKACANEPDKRFQTAQEFHEALRGCLESEKAKEAEKYVNEGRQYYYATGGKQDYPKALVCYQKAAELGSADAYNRIGIMYYYGYAVKKDEKKAMEYYLISADKGHMYAQYNLGWTYHNGTGIERDLNQAFYWYQKAAEQGHASAQNYVGHFYYNGYSVEQNYEEAVKWFQKSEKQGNIDARYNLGLAYFYGNGVEKDYKKAFELWKPLAEQNKYFNAMKKIANMYYYGNGVEKDYKESFKWYEKVAENNDAEAYNYLGVMYHSGNGVEQNLEKAVQCFQKSAENGDSYGMYNFGMMYHFGKGVKKDMILAKYWYEQAAAKGNTHAKTALEKLEK